MVTAELAVATLAALVVMLLLSLGVYLMVVQVRCIDTAGEVARQAARGETQQSLGPRGARGARCTSPEGGPGPSEGQRGGEAAHHQTGRSAAAASRRGRARAEEPR